MALPQKILDCVAAVGEVGGLVRSLKRSFQWFGIYDRKSARAAKSIYAATNSDSWRFTWGLPSEVFIWDPINWSPSQVKNLYFPIIESKSAIS